LFAQILKNHLTKFCEESCCIPDNFDSKSEVVILDGLAPGPKDPEVGNDLGYQFPNRFSSNLGILPSKPVQNGYEKKLFFLKKIGILRLFFHIPNLNEMQLLPLVFAL